MKEKVLEGSWIIDAPIEDVYRIISDFEKAPEYFPLVAKGMRVISRDGNNLQIEATTNTFGINFKVKMKTTLLPGKGFKSINESGLAIEDEQFILKPVAEGTRIEYVNKVKIKNNILNMFSRLIIGKGALKFWEFAYINKLKKILDKKS
ncbi:MAG: SRPBCC family protein [Candidatus Saccharimonadaceae bacterium]|nr:SRPBCC family protein [Candidatus Saccharimonadaceae bacterium]